MQRPAKPILYTLFLFLFAELFLTLLIRVPLPERFKDFANYIYSIPTTSIYQLSDDPNLSFELTPNTSQGHIHINSHGFRGREVTQQPPEGVTRIAILGDSETFASTLSDQDTPAGQLQTLLNHSAPDQFHQVLNFGFPGLNTDAEFFWMQAKIEPLNPHIVLLYYVLNDPIPDQLTILTKHTLLRNSKLYLFANYLKDNAYRQQIEQDFQSQDITTYYQNLAKSEDFAHVMQLLSEINNYLEEKSTRFIVVITPSLLGFDSFATYPYTNTHTALNSLTNQNVEVIDTLPAFQNQDLPPDQLMVSPHDAHKNKAGNHIIAREITKYLLANPSPPDQSATPSATTQ